MHMHDSSASGNNELQALCVVTHKSAVCDDDGGGGVGSGGGDGGDVAVERLDSGDLNTGLCSAGWTLVTTLTASTIPPAYL